MKACVQRLPLVAVVPGASAGWLAAPDTVPSTHGVHGAGLRPFTTPRT